MVSKVLFDNCYNDNIIVNFSKVLYRLYFENFIRIQRILPNMDKIYKSLLLNIENSITKYGKLYYQI
jgi:uncharacterized protein YqiB (DUF1249 family)